MKKRKSNLRANNSVHSSTYILNDKSDFYIKEAYRAARTNLSFALDGVEGCKIIAITSAVAGDGKTTTSVNLAISIAQANNRVLLIDADMRKGSVRRYLDLQRTNGLSSILSGVSKVVDEVIIKTPYGFDCMTAGPTPTNPAELLVNEVTKDMLDILSNHYDYILIDTPPVAIVSDALVLSKLVSGFVITVSEMSSTISEIAETVKALEFSDAKILGFMYNKSEINNSYGYKYKYRYKYFGRKYYNYYKAYKSYK